MAVTINKRYNIERIIAENKDTFTAIGISSGSQVFIKGYKIKDITASTYNIAKRAYHLPLSLGNRYTIKPIEQTTDETYIYNVYECIQGNNLRSLVDTKCPDHDLLAIFLNCTMGLKVLHDSNISHGDIKPSNIMCKIASSDIVYIDFEFSSDGSINYPPLCKAYTIAYCSPEKWLEIKNYDRFKDDIYSLGATFHMLKYGKHVYEQKQLEKMVRLKKTNDFVSLTSLFTKRTVNKCNKIDRLIESMISIVPNTRPCLEDVISTLKDI